MKILYIVMIMLAAVHTLHAQEQSKPARKLTGATQMDHKIADKLKVVLELNDDQWNKILKINEQLSERKKKAFKSSTDRAKVGQELQQIEDDRDKLYSAVLTEKQHELYVRKKKYLLSSNE
jgi:hypothetical protein